MSRPMTIYFAARLCDGCSMDVACGVEEFYADRDQPVETAREELGCPRPRLQTRRWFVCPQCPQVDFCGACKDTHEHACDPGPCHPDHASCMFCCQEVNPYGDNEEGAADQDQ